MLARAARPGMQVEGAGRGVAWRRQGSRDRSWLFCDPCGGLLDFLAAEGAAVCGVCGWRRVQGDFEGLLLESAMSHDDMRRRFGVEVRVSAAQSVMSSEGQIQRARVAETCPECGHPELEFFTMQLRSVDEGQTVFYECPKCRHKYSVNS